jgi:hypothetical protein
MVFKHLRTIPLLTSASHYQQPATPYGWANALSNYIAGSHLITLKGEGHTGYGRGSACTENAVDEGLINGTTPTKSLICAQ